jgi:hypothetical protein
MHNPLITALLVTITAAAAGAQADGSFDSDTNGNWYDAAPAQVPASFANATNAFQPGPPLDEQTAFSLSAAIGEPTGLGTNLWWPEAMAVDERVGGSFADTRHSRNHADALFPGLDSVRDNKSAPPFQFGLNHRFKFAEYGDERPGVSAPVGASYQWAQQRLEFFAEFGPILDIKPTTALEWNGGIGIRFNFRR